jgi:hypothetical protein
MLLVYNHVKHYRLHISEDHERNRRGYRKIFFDTLNVIRKRVTTNVIVEYSESTLYFYCLEIEIYYSDDGEIFSGPAQCCDVRHRLAGHVTKLLVTKNINNMDRVKREHRVMRYNIKVSSQVVQSIAK